MATEREELDVPNLPFKKPVEIERLENLNFSQRESMDPQEMKQRIYGIAHVLAKAYKKNLGPEQGDCISVIHAALSELGASLSGNFGAKMIGLSQKVAEDATKETFEE